jgi:hypothetical protein
MATYLEQLKTGIAAVRIHSLGSYSWLGKTCKRLPEALKKFSPPHMFRTYLISDLQRTLYRDFYCLGFPGFPSGEAKQSQSSAEQMLFARQLSAANSGEGHWEKGWVLKTIKEDLVYASRNSLDIVMKRESCDLAYGKFVNGRRSIIIRWPKELPMVSPGFYMALGDQQLGETSANSVLRLYLNLTMEGAIYLMRLLSKALNTAHIPYRFKVLKDLQYFSRSDAAVLYIRKADYPAVHELFQQLLQRRLLDQPRLLRQGTPAFTKRIANGIGLAENPIDGDSFGLHRCMLMAEGTVIAYERGKRALNDRINIVSDYFTQRGISLERPYLNPDSKDIYCTLDTLRGTNPARIRNLKIKKDDFLSVARAIGQAIVNQAVWQKGRCNWIGASPLTEGSAREDSGRRHAALSADLYSGTSGIALFLAELYAATGDLSFRQAAVGAAEQSFIATSSRQKHIGLFNGPMGVALSLARVGIKVDRRDLIQRAKRLLWKLEGVRPAEGEFDLIAGRAGAIIAYTTLAKILHYPGLIRSAVHLGNDLLRSAQKTNGHYSWGSKGSKGSLHLTGMSHGASGVAYALLGLFEATRERRFLCAAEGAFSYERQWFYPDQANWADLRAVAPRNKRRLLTLPYATYWCHGAPGIALTRLRSCEILNKDSFKGEALIALETTRQMVQETIHSGACNFSVCHGLAGNGEILMEGERVLGADFSIGQEMAREVGSAGKNMYGFNPDRWPCGLGGGMTPGLMCGLSGIGYFYLRLHNPAVPSIVMMRP